MNFMISKLGAKDKAFNNAQINKFLLCKFTSTSNQVIVKFFANCSPCHMTCVKPVRDCTCFTHFVKENCILSTFHVPIRVPQNSMQKYSNIAQVALL